MFRKMISYKCYNYFCGHKYYKEQNIWLIKAELLYLLEKEERTTKNVILTEQQNKSITHFVETENINIYEPSENKAEESENALTNLHYYKGHSRLRRSTKIFKLLLELKKIIKESKK